MIDTHTFGCNFDRCAVRVRPLPNVVLDVSSTLHPRLNACSFIVKTLHGLIAICRSLVLDVKYIKKVTTSTLLILLSFHGVTAFVDLIFSIKKIS